MSSKRTSPEEFYSLVMECKASCLSDAQWCLEHGIYPSTFYNWVSKLRKRACDIPQSVNHSDNRPAFLQDVVRLEVVQDKAAVSSSMYLFCGRQSDRINVLLRGNLSADFFCPHISVPFSGFT